MNELIVNLHMHSVYSDGSATHAQIARAAIRAGIDAVIITDHNVLVQGIEGYHHEGNRRVLVLVGEEIHDQNRQPQKNHLLVIGADRELATFAHDPQRTIDQANQSHGLTFLAHPYDSAMPVFGEDDISWVDWKARGYTGIELWNGFGELKTVVNSKMGGIFYAFFPHFIAHTPPRPTLQKWDELLLKGRRVVAIGGSDAHALHKNIASIRRIVFPYEFHFQAINTHILTPSPLSGDWKKDKRKLLDALKQGRVFIGYDLPAPTSGFRFSAHGEKHTATMGDEIQINGGLTFQIRIPGRAECRLICDGEPIKTWQGREVCTHITKKPGVYRVECYTRYLGKQRGWIFSNPIYVRPATK